LASFPATWYPSYLMDRRRFARVTAIILGDLALLNAALWFALTARHLAAPTLWFFNQHVISFNLIFLAWLVGFQMFGLYDVRRFRYLAEMLKGWIGAGSANLVWSLSFLYFFPPSFFVGNAPKTHLLLAWAFGHAAIFGWRQVLLRFLSLRRFRRRAAVFGDRAHVQEIAGELRRHPQMGYESVKWRWPGTDLVVADEKWVESHWMQAGHVLGLAAEHRVPVMGLARFYETILGKVPPEAAASAEWLIGAVYGRYGDWYLPAKRVVDVALSALMLVALAPVIVLTAAIVRYLDGSPVFFGQRRVGRMGREFVLWKFRTMKSGAEKSGPFAARKIREGLETPLGSRLRRYRIDEFPQLWNVLKGEMSLVGPRPEWSAEVTVLGKWIPHYYIRHLVKPGVTGWAQLNFRATNSAGDSLEKFRFDLYYIKNLSLALDLMILLRTVQRMFLSDSAVPAAQFRELKLSGRHAVFAKALGARAHRKRG